MNTRSRFFVSLKAAACTGVAGLALGASSVQAETLREALVAVYNTNPTLEGARANQRATDENVPIQRAPGLPSLNATATHIEFLRQSANAFIV